MCQRMKNWTEALVKKLKLSEISKKLWIYLIIDFITKLLLVARNNTILVVCNKLSKIMHFVATTERISVEELAKLFKDNMWKLHRLPESVVSDRELQFAKNLTKELNRMLRIKTRLLISFHSQINRQTEQMNQELEQYLMFFINYRQKDQLEWLTLAEFIVNNKVYLATKVSLFITNYSRELRMGANIRRKKKIEKVTKFVKKMKKVQEKMKR